MTLWRTLVLKYTTTAYFFDDIRPLFVSLWNK